MQHQSTRSDADTHRHTGGQTEKWQTLGERRGAFNSPNNFRREEL